MDKEKKLRKKSVLLIILLTLITYGIYQPIWFLKQKNAINNLKSKEKLTNTLFILVIILYAVSALFLFIYLFPYDTTSPLVIELIDNLINLTGAIIILVMSFKVRRILHQYFNVVLKRNIKFSKIYTFLFGIYYLQYKINRIVSQKK